jgi:hypothetical protein
MADSITPPPELVQQLRLSSGTWLDQITNAYQAGADQELEACCKWTAIVGGAEALRATRRPQPPSLKEQALAVLTQYMTGETILTKDSVDTIRRALEALDA